MDIPSQTLKTCTKCGTPKLQADFYLLSGNRRKNPNWNIVVAATCKECTKRLAKEHKARVDLDPQKLAAYKSKARKRCKRKHDVRREKVFAAYGGFECACCGETEPAFLSLDHVNNDGAEWRRERFGDRAAAGYHTYKWLIDHGFPPGFQVLCMNCQHGKRMRGGVCPHQRRSNDYPLEGVGSSDPKRTAPE